jgi:prefoldin subunit 5
LVEAAAQKFLDSSTQAHDAIVGANDVVHKTFAPAVQRLDDTISALSNAALVHKDMVQHVQKVQSDFVTQMAKLEQGVITVLSAVDSQMNSVMQNVDGQISAAATTLGAASKSAMADVTRVAQDVATSASRQIGQQMQSFSSSFDQAVRDLGGLANSLDTTISALNSTSNSVMVNTATLADDLHAIHEDLQQTILRLRA